jgi:hypothetical protein
MSAADATKTALTTTMLSQNQRKILKNRLVICLFVSCAGMMREHVEVPDPAHSFYAFGAVGPRAQFSAEIADMRIDAAIEGGKLAAQNGPNQLLAREHGACGVEKGLEKVEFDSGEVDGLAFAEGHARALIELNVLDRQTLARAGPGLLRGSARAAENRIDACGELAGIERLGKVIVGAHFQAEDPILVVAAGREHQDRSTRVSTNAAQNLETLDLGKHDVQDHDGMLSGEGALDAFQAGMHGLHEESLFAKVLSQKLAKLDIIVDNQDTLLRIRRGLFYVCAGLEPGALAFRLQGTHGGHSSSTRHAEAVKICQETPSSLNETSPSAD